MSESLPSRPNLNWLKNRAKQRLLQLRIDAPPTQLVDAQRVIAREYGFESWAKLKAEVDRRLALSSGAMTAAATGLDESALLKKFCATINRGDVQAARHILTTEAVVRENVNSPLFDFDAQPIIRAKNNPAMVDLLLEYGADINAKSKWWAGGFGVLDGTDPVAAEFLISRGAIIDIFAAAHLNRFDRVQELLDADPSLVNAKGGDGGRPLHFAGSVKMLDFLLDLGAEIDARDVDHEGTPAQWHMPRPVPEADLSLTRHLVSRGAAMDVFMAAALDDVHRLSAILNTDPTVLDQRVGETPTVLCPKAPGEHIYVYKLGRGMTAGEIATGFGSQRALQLLLSHCTPRQRFLLACSSGDRATAEQLRDEVHSLDPDDHGRLAKAAWDGQTDAVKLMLDLGFDPLAPGPDTGTALHCAAWQGRSVIVQIILTHPAVQPGIAKLINVKETTHHATPIDWCCHGSTMCRNPKGDYATVAKLLRDAGAVPGSNFSNASPEVRAVFQ